MDTDLSMWQQLLEITGGLPGVCCVWALIMITYTLKHFITKEDKEEERKGDETK